jgi:hypothetical protein
MADNDEKVAPVDFDDHLLVDHGLTETDVDAIRATRSRAPETESVELIADTIFQLALLLESLVDFLDDTCSCCRSVWLADPSDKNDEFGIEFLEGAGYTRIDFARKCLSRLKVALHQARKRCEFAEDQDWFSDVSSALETLRAELHRVSVTTGYKGVLDGLIRAKRTTRGQLVIATAKLWVAGLRILRSRAQPPSRTVKLTVRNRPRLKLATLSPAQLEKIFDCSWKTFKHRLSVFGGTIKSEKISTKSYLIDESELPTGWENRK